MGDAQVEGATNQDARILQRIHAPEVVPQPKGDNGEFQFAVAAAPVLHAGIASVGRQKAHSCDLLSRLAQRRKATLNRLYPQHGLGEGWSTGTFPNWRRSPDLAQDGDSRRPAEIAT
jgi:hypothetical protein